MAKAALDAPSRLPGGGVLSRKPKPVNSVDDSGSCVPTMCVFLVTRRNVRQRCGAVMHRRGGALVLTPGSHALIRYPSDMRRETLESISVDCDPDVRSGLNAMAVVTVAVCMDAIRCSCGASHSRDAMHPIGRQRGLDGEYMDLGNCPSCGSTLCIATNPRGATSQRAAAQPHSRTGG